jgi:polysaccharide biosynthesis transport protein
MDTEPAQGLGELLGAVKRRRMVLAGVAAPVLILAGALALGLPDIYQSEATFTLIEQTELDDAGTSYDDQYVYALADRVKRSPELTAIVAELNPYPKLADEPGEALGRLKEDISIAMVTEQLLDPRSGREVRVFKGFRVGYSNPSPEMAEQVAQRLPDLYLRIGRSTALERASHKIGFLTSEADQKRALIMEQEKRLAEFKQRNFEQLPEVAQANMNLRAQTERQLEDTERELRGARQNRVFLAQQLNQEQSGPTVGNLRQLEEEYSRKSAVYAADHPDVVALRRQIDNLRRSGPSTSGSSLQADLDSQREALAEARQRYSDDHPDIRRLVRNIESLEARLAAGESGTASRSAPTVLSVQLQTQLNALDTQIGGLEGRSAELRGQIYALSTRIGSTPEVEREYQAIARDLDSARQLHDNLTSQRMAAELEAAAVSSGTADRFRLLDPPRLPLEPSQPARLRILVLGFIAAFVLAVAAAVAAEMLDTRVRGSRDIRNVLQISPLATVPTFHNSVYVRRHRRRLAAFAASVIVGAPLAYLAVSLLAT